MNEEAKADEAQNPLEQLTSLVLDAADAANDSAQSTQEAISRLAQVVETNEETTRAVRNAPAIFGAIMLSVGIVMAVVVAIVFSKVNEKAASLDVAIAAQNESIEQLDATLKELKLLEANLEKFKTIAEDTTQRAVVTLREQVKTDRVALQQLEVKRLNEMLASLRGAVATAPRALPARPDEMTTKVTALEESSANLDSRLTPTRLEALEAGIKRIDTRLAAMEKAGSPATGEGANAKRAVAVLSDAQAKDMKAAVAELAQLKKEISTLRDLIERRNSELQSGVPSFRKPGGG
jgi:DNA repair exonuclease SbcCD ATPase subunit